MWVHAINVEAASWSQLMLLMLIGKEPCAGQSIKNEIGRKMGTLRIIRKSGLKIPAFLHIQIATTGMKGHGIEVPDRILRPGVGCLLIVVCIFL